MVRGRLNPSVTSQESPRRDEQISKGDHSSATGVGLLVSHPLFLLSLLCDFFVAAHGRLVVSSQESARELKGAGVCRYGWCEEQGVVRLRKGKRKKWWWRSSVLRNYVVQQAWVWRRKK